MEELIVKASVQIDATVAKVWEVLVAPKFIRQWDSLPDDFPDYYLEVGMEILWTGNSKLTVTDMVAHERLKLSVYQARWEMPPSSYDFSYTYLLSDEAGQTELSIEIGDFSQLNDGGDFYNTSVEFASKALSKIKLLAENRI